MSIETFEDIISEHQLSRETLHGIEEKLRAAQGDIGERKFAFTDLQKVAFNNPGFWRGKSDTDRRHIIVQGATSAGKTLVSEMAILDCLKSRKKAIVLVPLKAMVRERTEHFKEDLKLQGTRQVYASSSDFQDHDGDIVRGDYEVAVIVYEKFFAMLSQQRNSMLNDCALLVVDELQMLSSDKRGPKLEIGIQKILRNNRNPQKNAVYTRIMCLTTCDCKVEYISNWLTVKEGDETCAPILIKSEKRPVGLREHVLGVNGKWKMQYVPGEWDVGEEKKMDEGDLMEGKEYKPNEKSEQAKREMLKILLKKIYRENNKAKVLIFANGRERTRELAEFVSKQNILPLEQLSEKAEGIENYDEDEYQSVLKTSLLPHRIAFHNAALSTALREFIEDLFHEEDALRLVVATETLTVGMNMPVDVMILYDAKVFHGGQDADNLSGQEYKNFVGRAGRLGQTNRKGESYILAASDTDYNLYWDIYVNLRKEEISSALLTADEAQQAPYYLSLLEMDAYRMKALTELQEESFARKCSGKPIDMEKVVKKLQNAKLCRSSSSSDDDVDEEEQGEVYKLSDFGKMMAPYAFSLSTCKKNWIYFFNGGMEEEQKKQSEDSKKPEEGYGGMPFDISAEDIRSDKYLLDILYVICSTRDIKSLSQLKIPSGNSKPEKAREALDKIEEALERMVKTDKNPDGPCEVWPNSPLQSMLENGYDEEAECKECIMRTILLYYWTKGKYIHEITDVTGFDRIVRIVNGDMARLAEAVSYQLEAIYRCFGGYRGRVKMKPDAMKSLYQLSTRINYGMPRELVIIANRHLHGLDRKVVLKIGKAARKSGRYDSPVDFLKRASKEELKGILTEQQRKELLESIDALYLHDSFEEVLDKTQERLGERIFGNEVCDLYSICDEIEGSELLKPLEKIFWTEDSLTQENVERFYRQKVKVNLVGDRNIGRLTLEQGDFVIGASDGTTDTLDKFRHYICNLQENTTNILLVMDETELAKVKADETGAWKLVKEDGSTAVSKLHLAMTIRSFSELLLQDMALEDKEAAVLSAMLKDTSGIFQPTGLGSLHPLLENYELDTKTNLEANEQDAVLRILLDKRIGPEHESYQEIKRELAHRNIPFRVLQWGESLEKECSIEAPTLLYFTWDAVKSSKSLKEFHRQLKRNHYKNTYAIFDSQELFENWGTDNSELTCNELPHCIRTSGMKQVGDVVKCFMQTFQRTEFLIGISYAHEPKAESDSTADRATVVQFKEVIERINEAFGERMVLYDQNLSSKDHFDGNGAIPATLELYRQCKYFIVLDDQYYDRSGNCKKEGKVIKEKLKALEPRHLWLLHPDNDAHCKLFDEESDYSTRLKLTEESTEQAAGGIIRSIMEQEGIDACDR